MRPYVTSTPFLPALAVSGFLGVPLVGAASAAQVGPAPRAFAEAGHPVCQAWIHAWAADGAEGPLVTYGSPSIDEYGVVATTSLLGAGALAVGLDLDGGSGPLVAGSMTPGPTDGSFVYRGPSEPDDLGVGARARAQLGVDRLVLAGDVTIHQARVRPRLVVIGIDAGPLDIRAGLLALRSGPGCGDGLVLGASERAEAWGVELRQRAPLRIPILGTIRIGAQVGALREAGPANRWPLFHSMRVELRPDEDWVLGLNRAVIFGGSGTEVDVTVRAVALMLLGITDAPGKSSAFENQVASVDVRWRTRIATRPVLITAEYGADDSGLAFLNVPGFRGTSEMSLGPETGWIGMAGTWVAGSRKTYPPWYRHGALAWGWTDRGRPLGNSLGGNAKALLATYRREWTARTVDIAAGPVDRGHENLYAPDLEGLALHVSAAVLWNASAWEVRMLGAADVADELAVRGSFSVLRRVGGR